MKRLLLALLLLVPLPARANLSPETMIDTDISGSFIYNVANTPQKLYFNKAFVAGLYPWPLNFTSLVTATAGLTVPNGSGAVSAPQYNTPGNTFTGSGTAIPPRLNLNLNLAGTITGQSYVNYLTVSGDTAACSGGANGGCFALGIQENVGGSTVTGGRGPIWAQLNISGLTNHSLEMTGINSTIFANGVINGAFLQPLTSSVVLNSGADAGNTLDEFTLVAKSGSSVGNKGFLQFTYGTADVVAGSSIDAAVIFASNNSATSGSPGGGMMLSVGNVNQGFPVSSIGTILGTNQQISNQSNGRNIHFIAPATKYGVDFTGVDFTLASGRAFMSPGFSVDGVGQVRVSNGFIGPISTGLSWDIDRQIVTGATVAAGGGGGGTGTNDYYVGDILSDGNGGHYQVATVSSGGVATVTILNGGVSSSPPSNPVATTGGSGINATLNLTWAAHNTISIGTTSAAAIALGNSGSTTTITGTIKAGASTGVSCSGSPTSSFASVNGIVTHC